MNLVVLILAMFASTISFAQPANTYYPQIDSAEAALAAGNTDLAVDRYVSTLETYDYPLFNHLYQATIVAAYGSNDESFHKLMERCFLAGLSKSALEDFRELHSVYVDSLLKNYSSAREAFLEKLDTAKLLAYIGVDVMAQVSVEDSYLGDRSWVEKAKAFEQQAEVLTQHYLDTLELYGWPDYRETGLGYAVFVDKKNGPPPTYANWMQREYTLPFQSIGYPSSLSIGIGFIKEVYEASMWPGNWFISHHVPSDEVSTRILMDSLIRGLQYLEVEPLTIAFYVENLQESGPDLGITYYSRSLITSFKWDRGKLYKLPLSQRNIMNKARARIHYRQLSTEEALFNSPLRFECGEVV